MLYFSKYFLHFLVVINRVSQYLSQCDEVILMDSGRILDQGRHVDLINQNQRYASLIETFMNETSESLVNEADLDLSFNGDQSSL